MAFRNDGIGYEGFSDVSVRLRGYGSLKAMLDRLPLQMRHEVSYDALNAASAVMLSRAQAEVPIGKPGQRYDKKKRHTPGTLRKSLQIQPGEFKGKSITFAVGASFLDKTFGNYDDAFYGGFIEFGHRFGSRKSGIRRTKIKSIRTGKRGRQRTIVKKHDLRKLIPPNPFLARAFRAGRAAAVDKAAAVIRSEVVRLANIGII